MKPIASSKMTYMNYNLLSIILGKSSKIIIANTFYQNNIASAFRYFSRSLKEKYLINTIKNNNLKYFAILWKNFNCHNFHDNENKIIKLTIRYGSLPILKYLHQNNVNIYHDNYFPMKCASFYGHLDIVKYLHQNGTDVSDDNNFPIRLACLSGHLEIVKYLHENGANFDINYFSIRSACQNGHLDVVKYMCQNGVNDFWSIHWGINSASENGHSNIVKYLSQYK